jgi:predicted NAD/FAD-binding protein
MTVAGGARSYASKLTAPFVDRVRLGRPVVRAIRERSGVKLTTADGSVETFDKVIFASHADQTLRMLADADSQENRLLREFKYQPNLATVHTDERVMPRTRLCWSSWNYRIDRGSDGADEPSTVYWMNSLQGVSERQNYFVSINGERRIDPARILKQIPYEHPLFNLAAIQAQAKLPKLNQRDPKQPVYFCGSYFQYGFHEDAFTSALELCRVILEDRIWA